MDVMLRELEQGLEERCLYCRESPPKFEEEAERRCMERVKVNDPDALCQMGKKYLARDYDSAFAYLTKAAALGDFDAHYELSVMYRNGEGAEKDLKKEIHHLEEAAIGGHPLARYNLGADEWDSGRYDRAAKHFIISAKQGYDDALEMVKKGFTKGFVSKEEFEAALRGHQAAVDAAKSEQRDAAAEYHEWRNQQDGWPPKEVVGDK